MGEIHYPGNMFNTIEQIIQYSSEIEQKIGYVFNQKDLLVLAFTHCSYVNEHQDVDAHNERLEFLGDSVLGLLISDFLFRSCPNSPEGDLSLNRSRLVEASSCSEYVHKLKIEGYVLLGKGERMNDGRGRETILADLFEAVIGAIYLDGGLDAAKNFLFSHFTEDFANIIEAPTNNWKAELQDYLQKEHGVSPKYTLISEKGPDHSKIFEIAVFFHDQELGRGVGSSKKEAQQAAAAKAFQTLNLQH